jgi:hypothetical protein
MGGACNTQDDRKRDTKVWFEDSERRERHLGRQNVDKRMMVLIFTLDCVRVFTKVQLCKGVDWIQLAVRGALLLTC